VNPLWNWKTAFNSGLYRGIPFAVATWRAGLSEALAGAATQFLLFAFLAGLTGALAQRLRFHAPKWRAALVLMFLVPASVHLIEWVAHEALSPGVRRAGIFVSWAQSALSMGTQWWLMRRGLFLAGEGGQPYWRDFVLLPAAVRQLWGRSGQR
jgi:hypothetical protein